MKTILYFPRNALQLLDKSHYDLPKLYAERQWNVQFANSDISSQEAISFLSFWKPDGCIVNNDRLPQKLFKDIPTVFTHRSQDDMPNGSAIVSYDERAIAQLAARELLSLHCASYVYVPEGNGDYWDVTRASEFVSAIRTGFQKTDVFPTPREGYRSHAYRAALARWLQKLPRPVGIFAAYDVISEIVLGTCQHIGLETPKDAMIVGVENDIAICENTRTTLSSIAFDEKRVVDASVQLLARQMESRRPSAHNRVFVPPVGVVRRASTRIFNKADAQVIAALDVIRIRGGDGLTAKEVVETFPCSRRMAELRFRAATGHSILEEILAIRAEKAQKLRAAGLKDEAVAQMCGYSVRSSLRRLLEKSKSRCRMGLQRDG